MKMYTMFGIGALVIAATLMARGEPKAPPADAAAPKISTALMYFGKAEEAMKFYMSLFPDSRIIAIKRYGKGEEPGVEGTVEHATFTLAGREFMCFDSDAKYHNFTFTPSISLFVTCRTEAEVDELFGKLSEGGEVMMPVAEYPFSKRYGWCSDRFGVSWQVMLPNQ